MRVIRTEKKVGPRVIALGTFDGVHRGHQTLIQQAAAYAAEKGVPLRVCTFDRHPLEIIHPEAAPGLLTTLPEKLHFLASMNVSETEVLSFTAAMAGQEPEAFLEALRNRMDLLAVFAGWNYTFGRMGRGNPELLQQDGKRYGYVTRILRPVRTDQGEIISSSTIRASLAEGQLEKAEQLLGHPYALTGIVVEGKHLGRTLGFPTANVRVHVRKQLPAFGVYLCLLEDQLHVHPAMVNIGTQPTLPSGHVTVEAHILDGDPNEYGHWVRLTLLRRLRDEKRFDSAEMLKAQLEADKQEALNLFHMA